MFLFKPSWPAVLLLFGLFQAGVAASPQDAELLRLTNAERARASVPALCLGTRLGQAAQRHAEDMAHNDYFSHTGRNGSSVGERVDATGYAHSWVGENISSGRADAAATVQAWMHSTGHRENILRAEYTQIGFGYAYNPASAYRHYWVQVFGTPQGGGGCGSDSRTMPTPVKPDSTGQLNWLRTWDVALSQAKQDNKLILMVAGRDDCGSTQYMRNKVIAAPDAAGIARDKFVLWYTNVDTDSEWRKYTRGYLRQFSLPVIAVINPFDPDNYLDRSFGGEKAEVFAGWLQSFAPPQAIAGPTPDWREIHPDPPPPVAAGPVITGLVPSVLRPLPAGERQWQTIQGRNFGNDSRLELTMLGGQVYENRIPATFSPTELKYRINVSPLERTWEVRVVSGGQKSNAYRFQVSGSANAQPDSASPASVPTGGIRRAEVIEMAERYANYRFTVRAANLPENISSNCAAADTPGTYQGMLYNWGGFDNLEQFQAKLERDAPVGNVCSKHGVRNNAAGIDTSGFISRVWGLRQKYGTRTLSQISSRITHAELKPGDILVKPGAHARLFVGRTADGQMMVYEASGARDLHRVVKPKSRKRNLEINDAHSQH